MLHLPLFEHLIEQLLLNTPYRFKDIESVIVPTLNAKENIKRIHKELVKKGYAFDTTLQQLGLSQQELDWYLATVNDLRYGAPNFKEEALKHGIKPLTGKSDQWKNVVYYGLDTETLHNRDHSKETETYTLQIFGDGTYIYHVLCTFCKYI